MVERIRVHPVNVTSVLESVHPVVVGVPMNPEAVSQTTSVNAKVKDDESVELERI